MNGVQLVRCRTTTTHRKHHRLWNAHTAFPTEPLASVLFTLASLPIVSLPTFAPDSFPYPPIDRVCPDSTSYHLCSPVQIVGPVVSCPSFSCRYTLPYRIPTKPKPFSQTCTATQCHGKTVGKRPPSLNCAITSQPDCHSQRPTTLPFLPEPRAC